MPNNRIHSVEIPRPLILPKPHPLPQSRPQPRSNLQSPPQQKLSILTGGPRRLRAVAEGSWHNTISSTRLCFAFSFSAASAFLPL